MPASRSRSGSKRCHGVGAINLVGGRVRAMNVVVDTDRLAGYNLSVDDVRQALVRQNLEVPGGRVDQGPRELVLRTLGRLRTEREFNDLIVANRNGYPDPRARRRPRRAIRTKSPARWPGSTAMAP